MRCWITAKNFLNNCNNIFLSVLKDGIYQKWSQFAANGLVSMFPTTFSCGINLFFNLPKSTKKKKKNPGCEVFIMQIKNSDEDFMFSRKVEVQFLGSAVFSAYSVRNSHFTYLNSSDFSVFGMQNPVQLCCDSELCAKFF